MAKKLFTEEAIEEAQIEDWKAKYKKVFAIPVCSEDDDDSPKVTGYFRKPSVDELGLMQQASNKVAAVKILYNTCLLGGHPLFENDEDIMQGAMKQFQTVLKTRYSEIKKL